MAIGLILGMTLITVGLVLLCHLSYTNWGESDKSADAQDDIENASVITGKKATGARKHNDCLLPFCFFQAGQVYNHESWIVAFLMTGSTVLLLSLV